MKTLLLAASILLTACGGQATPLTSLPVLCYTPVDKATPSAGCLGQLQGSTSKNPVQSVHTQALLSGPLILWAGAKRDFAVNAPNFQTLINTAMQYPGKFPYVFLYDEPGWCGFGACPWTDEATVLQQAAIAHQAGIGTMINIMPDVILDDRFAMQNINAFDVISIDVYPSARPGVATPPYLTLVPNSRGCNWSNNQGSNLAYCAAQRLRSNGFRGYIALVYQGFGVRTIPSQTLYDQLMQQRETVSQAQAMGFAAVMPWGLYLGAAETAEDGNLFQLAGTQYEWMILP